MTNVLLKYSMMNSFYNEGQDILDAYWPFSLCVLEEGKPSSNEQIQLRIKERFDFTIPIHTLRTINSNAIKKGYLEYHSVSKKYNLTESGHLFKQKIDDSEIRRSINALIADLRDFLITMGINIDADSTELLLNGFIEKNIALLIEFISHRSSDIQFSKLSRNEELLIKYIEVVEDRKPNEYRTLFAMIYGSIISSIIFSGIQDKDNFDTINKKPLENCTFYLDTNVIFSIFEIHPAEISKPVIELMKLLRDTGCKFKIFKFTIDEIEGIFNGYSRKYNKYLKDVRVDTIYSYLKTRGFDKAKCTIFLATLEENLKKLGIEIDEDVNVVLSNYCPKDKNIVDILRKEINYTNRDLALYHDAAVIEAIKSLRKRKVKTIEEADYTFLTSNVKLSRVNKSCMGHNRGEVPEVILDRVLTNILWLKNPAMKLSLRDVIAVHPAHIFIKKEVWDNFYDTICKLKSEGKVSSEDISLLLFDSQIEAELNRLSDEENVESTNFEKIIFEEIESIKEEREKNELIQIEAIKKELNSEYSSIIKEKSEFISELEAKIKEQSEIITDLTQTDKENQRKLLNKIQKLEEEHTKLHESIEKRKKDEIEVMKRKSKSIARLFTYLTRVTSIILTLFFIYSLVVTYNWMVYGSLITLAITISGISFREVWNKIEDMVCRRVYTYLSRVWVAAL